MKEMAYRDLESIGFPRSITVEDRGPRGDARRALDLRHPGLRIADAEALKAVPGVESVKPNIWGTNMVVIGPAGRRALQVEGVDAGYLDLPQQPDRGGAGDRGARHRERVAGRRAWRRGGGGPLRCRVADRPGDHHQRGAVHRDRGGGTAGLRDGADRQLLGRPADRTCRGPMPSATTARRAASTRPSSPPFPARISAR